MAITLDEIKSGKVLEVRLSGKLAREDYKHFVPEADRLIQQHGKIRILLEMEDFHGWEMGALWEDLKFDARHFSHIERIAMVGDKTWEKAMSTFCKPFTTAKIRYFDQSKLPEAREWLDKE